jgi:hypothetical protein
MNFICVQNNSIKNNSFDLNSFLKLNRIIEHTRFRQFLSKKRQAKKNHINSERMKKIGEDEEVVEFINLDPEILIEGIKYFYFVF